MDSSHFWPLVSLRKSTKPTTSAAEDGTSRTSQERLHLNRAFSMDYAVEARTDAVNGHLTDSRGGERVLFGGAVALTRASPGSKEVQMADGTAVKTCCRGLIAFALAWRAPILRTSSARGNKSMVNSTTIA